MSSPLHPCAACGALVFSGPPGSLETCRACGWIDDLTQLAHPDVVFGANSGVSLREAQRRVGAVGTAQWRPLRPREQPKSPLASPACALGVPEREGFVPYWKR